MDEAEYLKRYITKILSNIDEDLNSPIRKNNQQKELMFDDSLSRIKSVYRYLPRRLPASVEVEIEDLVKFMKKQKDKSSERDEHFSGRQEKFLENLKMTLSGATSEQAMSEAMSEAKNKYRHNFFEKEDVVELRNGQIKNVYFEKMVTELGERLKTVLSQLARCGIGQEEFYRIKKTFGDLFEDIAQFGVKQNKFCRGMEEDIYSTFSANPRMLEELFNDTNLEVIQKYKNGELPVANNGQFDFYIIKEPTIDETSKKVLGKGEICSVAAFERVYGLAEDDKNEPTTIRVEGDNLVYYMTLEENQKLLESYKDKTGQDLSKEYGEEVSKREKRDDKTEDKDEWENSPFD